MNLRIHNDFSKADLNEMQKIYASVGWNKHSKEIIKQIFEASNVLAFAIVDDRIVGFGRAMTDGVFNAAIYDVLVHPEFQNQGIAKQIMKYPIGKT